MLKSVALTLFAVLGGGIAFAQWSTDYRADFMRDCMVGCEENPRIHPSKRGLCGAYCQCFAQETEREFPVPSLLEAERERDPNSVMVQRFRSIGTVCNQRVFQSQQ